MRGCRIAMRGGVCARHGAMRKDSNNYVINVGVCIRRGARRSEAVSMDAQIKLTNQECAEVTGHVAILMTNLLHIFSIMKIKEHPS